MNNGRLRVLFLILADFITFYSVVIAVAWIYNQFGRTYEMKWYFYLWPAGLALIAFNSMIRLYQGNCFYPGAALSAVEELRRLFFSTTILYLVLLAYFFVIRSVENYSRFVLFASYFLVILMLPISRWIARSLMKHYRFSNIRALMVGAGHTGEIIVKELLRERQSGLIPVGFLDDDPQKQSKTVMGVSVLGKISDCERIARELKITYAIICLPMTNVLTEIRELSKYFRHILIIPTNQIVPAAWLYPYEFSCYMGLEIRNQLLLPGPRILKWVLEGVQAIAAILVLMPLFLLLAVVVKVTSSGPVFYRARRLGKNGKIIEVLKFRTMYVDADDKLERILAEDPVKAKEWNEKFKLSDDPRITPVGKFLRRSSLDELPQFWNVLNGDMAIIGPRPIVEAEKIYYGEHYELLSRVKPGITGLWQVSGRSDLDYERRVFLDMYYIMNWTVWLDYFIFLKTVKEVIFCRGAK